MRATCPHCNHYGPWRYIGSGEDERGRRWESYRCAWCGYVRTVAVG